MYSLKCALERQKAKVRIGKLLPSPEKLDGLVLPGVGSFDAGAASIARNRESINSLRERGVPLLGICLGLQLFFPKSEEGTSKGAGFFNGSVKRLGGPLKVPHMGWNTLRITSESPLLEGVSDGEWVYFVHSYYPVPRDRGIITAEADYGVTFPAAVSAGNIFGTQFHPEKSGVTGAKILERYVELCRR